MKEMTEVEIEAQVRRYNSGQDEPPYQGAIPDWHKLEASIQMDPYELWWRGSKCDLCPYEASYLDLAGYRCDQHSPSNPGRD